jgi:hypothetical protein
MEVKPNINVVKIKRKFQVATENGAHFLVVGQLPGS